MRNTMIITEELQLPEITECNKWHSKHPSSQMLVREMNQLHHTAHSITQETDLTTQLTMKNDTSILLPEDQWNTEKSENQASII